MPTRPESGPARDADRPLIAHRNLHIIFAVTMMVIMGVSSIAPALPVIVADLGLDAMGAGWLVTSFTLPGVFLTPFLGVAADRFGRKPVLVPSLVVFAVFGTACGFTHDFQTLVILRFFQGVGAASLGVLNLTILSDLYDGPQRTQAMGYNAGVLSLGTTIYPALGGGLAMFGWRYPFLLPVVALPLAVWVALGLDAPRPARSSRFMEYMKKTMVLAMTPRAMGLFATTAATFIILYGLLITYLPLYMDQRFGAPPSVIGAVIAGASLTTALMSSLLGRISRAVPLRWLLGVAFALYGVSALLVPLMPGPWWVAVPVLVFGVAQGLNIPSVQTLLAGLAPMEQRGAFMAINGMILRLGQTLGPLFMGAAYYWGGMNGVFVGTAVLAVIAAVLAMFSAEG